MFAISSVMQTGNFVNGERPAKIVKNRHPQKAKEHFGKKQAFSRHKYDTGLCPLPVY